MSKVKIGFVGVGFMGQRAHLQNYVNVPDCEVVAISELRPEMGKLVAARYGVPKVYLTAEEMFAAEKLDGVVASQPFHFHGSIIPMIAKHKLPVFTEKPISNSIATGEKICKALQETGTWQMVGYHKRNDPAVAYAIKQIADWKTSGEVGKMKYIRALMPAGDWVGNGARGLLSTDEKVPTIIGDPNPPDMDETLNNEYQGFVNYYIHQVNLIAYLLGERYRATYAEKSGVLMAGESISGIPIVLEMTPYFTSMDWQESYLIGFEKGYIKIELPCPLAHNRPGRIEIFKDGVEGVSPTTTVPMLPFDHAMFKQAENFVAAVAGKAKPACDAAEALEDIKVAREYIRLRFGK